MDVVELAELSDVSFPDMRRNVVSAVRARADSTYQRRVWIEHDYLTGGYRDDLAVNVHILFDDTLVFEDPAATLGMVLKSREKVEVMAVLADAFDGLFESRL